MNSGAVTDEKKKRCPHCGGPCKVRCMTTYNRIPGDIPVIQMDRKS